MSEPRIELREYSYGWNITVLDENGRAKHVGNAESEIQAYRHARRAATVYRISGQALVVSRRGEYCIDLAMSENPPSE